MLLIRFCIVKSRMVGPKAENSITLDANPLSASVTTHPNLSGNEQIGIIIT